MRSTNPETYDLAGWTGAAAAWGTKLNSRKDRLEHIIGGHGRLEYDICGWACHEFVRPKFWSQSIPHAETIPQGSSMRTLVHLHFRLLAYIIILTYQLLSLAPPPTPKLSHRTRRLCTRLFKARECVSWR